MKRHTKQFISSVCTLVLLGNIHIASAELANDTETLLNWAKIPILNSYPAAVPHRVWIHGYTDSIPRQIFMQV